MPKHDQNMGRCESNEEQRVYDDFKKILRLAEGSIKAGRLAIVGNSYPYPNSEIGPGAFIAWARSKDYEIPAELEGIEAPPTHEFKPQQAGPDLKPSGEPVIRKHVETRRAKLSTLLDEIDARAGEAGLGFARGEFPGTKNEFREFIEKRDLSLFHTLPTDNDRLGDDLKPLGVRFLPGNNRGKGRQFFEKLFPEPY